VSRDTELLEQSQAAIKQLVDLARQLEGYVAELMNGADDAAE